MTFHEVPSCPFLAIIFFSVSMFFVTITNCIHGGTFNVGSHRDRMVHDGMLHDGTFYSGTFG